MKGLKFNDPEVIAKINYAFSLGASIKIACDYAGVDDSTYYIWQQKANGGMEPYKSMFVEFRKHAATGDIHALDRIKQEREEGSWQAAAWLLERRHPNAYGANAHLRELSEKVDLLLKDKINGQQTESPREEAEEGA